MDITSRHIARSAGGKADSWISGQGGDVVDMEVYARYGTWSGTNTNTITGAALIVAIAAAFTPVGASPEMVQFIHDPPLDFKMYNRY